MSSSSGDPMFRGVSWDVPAQTMHDAGLPFLATPAGDGTPIAVLLRVCARVGCGAIHVGLLELDSIDETAVCGDVIDPPAFTLDPDVMRLSPENAGAAEMLERNGWLTAWLWDQRERVRARCERLRLIALSEPADARPPPAWRPGELVRFIDVYPHDMSPAVHAAGQQWIIEDAYCPDPACDRMEARLTVIDPSGAAGETLRFCIRDAQPTQASRRGRTIWAAIQRDDVLFTRLFDRRVRLRIAGPYIVGSAYEEARRAAVPSALPPAETDGSLSSSAVERLHSVAVRFHRGRRDLFDLDARPFRLVVTGAMARAGWLWAFDDLDAPAWEMSRTLLDRDGVELELAITSRDAQTDTWRRWRLAHGWPLIGGWLVPLVGGARAGDEEPSAATVGETLLALEITELLMDVARSLVKRPQLPVAPEEWSRAFTTESGEEATIRIVASHPDAPWPRPASDGEHDDEHSASDRALDRADHDEHAASDHEHDDDARDAGDHDDGDGHAHVARDVGDDDDDDDEGDPEAWNAGLLVAEGALDDYALQRGLGEQVRQVATRMLAEVASYIRNYEDEATSWFSPRQLATYLERHAPRKSMFDDEELAALPDALAVLVDWVVSTGHGERDPLRRVLRTSVPVFLSRVRDPRNFGLAKSMFAAAARARVDVSDEDAMNRFLQETVESPSGLSHIAPRPTPLATEPPTVASHQRWQPAPGEPRPAPTDPCPCGRGRRYKKCCMKR